MFQLTSPAISSRYLPSAPLRVKMWRVASLVFLLCLTVLPWAHSQELAAWVVRFDIDTPEKINKVCSPAGSENFDRLLVQVRGRADAWYQSHLVPTAEELDDNFDPLQQVLDNCDKVALEAWLNVYYLWTGNTPPKDSRHPALHPNWLIQDHQGRSIIDYTSLMQSQHWVEGIYADPGSAAFRSYFCTVISDLLDNYPIRAIHLDFVRYPGPFFGSGNSLAHTFSTQYGFDPRWLPEKLTRQQVAAWYDGSLSNGEEILVSARLIWDLMRAAEVSSLVHDVARIVHQQAGFTLSTAVFPDPLAALLNKGQDWPDWLRTGLIDKAFVMTYFGDEERIAGQLEEISAVAGGQRHKIWAGLGAYIKDPADIGRESRLCKQFGLDRLGLFSLGHLQRKQCGVAPFSQQSNAARARIHKKGQADYLYLAIKQFQQLLQNQQAALNIEPRIKARLAFFEQHYGIISQNISSLAAKKVIEPFWYDSRGIFRYLHRHDSMTKGEEQLELISQAREKLLTGFDFNETSRLLSQAGSRHNGGVQPREYCLQPPPFTHAIGQISPIIAKHNGFWVKQVMATGGGRRLALHSLPWPAQRLLLRQQLITQ